MSELLYAGKTMVEIAGWDDCQMRWVVCRKRDKSGRLVRRDPSLPDWVETDERGMRVVTNPVPYSTMFRQVMRGRGLTDREAAVAWAAWRTENPQFGRGGER